MMRLFLFAMFLGASAPLAGYAANASLYPSAVDSSATAGESAEGASPGEAATTVAADTEEQPSDAEPFPTRALEQMSNDRDRWLLRDQLQHEFAQTLDLSHAARRTLSLNRSGRPWTWQIAVAERLQLAQLFGMPRHHFDLAGVAFDIPLANHPLVDTYIEYFTGRGRGFFERWLARAQRYVPIMQPILQAHGLPKDTVYVAMIESGFNAGALSSARAVGYWQFIRSTAQLYGLREDAWVDERRDFILATRAAARYLKDLHGTFGDWHLAWASYNAGGGRIRRELDKYGVTDFWQLLMHNNSLAKETQHYVPKVIAAAIIAKSPRRYGFSNITGLAPLAYDEITVHDSTNIRALADALGVPVLQLQELNPALNFDVTPPRRTMTLRVPAGQQAAAIAALPRLPKSEAVGLAHHTVARGDTLYSIARRYGTSVAEIVAFNSMRGVAQLRLGQRLIIPSRSAAVSVAARPPAGKVAEVKAVATAVRVDKRPAPANQLAHRGAKHVVSHGDTLWSIAQRYGVTVASIKSLNGRRTNALTVGDVLRIVGGKHE